MLFHIDQRAMLDDGTECAVLETTRYTVCFSGIFLYASYHANEDSICAFCDAWRSGDRSFDNTRGSFHMVMMDKQLHETYFITDNAGTQCFYLSEDYASTSFLRLLEKQKRTTPDHEAIADYIQFGCVYSRRTFVNEIKRTSPDRYYCASEQGVAEYDKRLKPFEEMNGGSLRSWIADVSKKTEAQKAAAVVTGGVDSRMVLANLVAAETETDLVISGEAEHIDASIASEIAQVLHKGIDIIPGQICSIDDFYEAYRGLDGIGDCITLYRLVKPRRHLNQNNYQALWGGISGELYKNSFLNQDFPNYRGAPDFSRFLI